MPVLSLLAYSNVPATPESEHSPIDEVESGIAELMHQREDLMASLTNQVELIAKQYGEYTTRIQNRIATARQLAAQVHSDESPDFVNESDALAEKWLKRVRNTTMQAIEFKARATKATSSDTLDDKNALLERNRHAIEMIEQTEEAYRDSLAREADHVQAP